MMTRATPWLVVVCTSLVIVATGVVVTHAIDTERESRAQIAALEQVQEALVVVATQLETKMSKLRTEAAGQRKDFAALQKSVDDLTGQLKLLVMAMLSYTQPPMPADPTPTWPPDGGAL